MKSTLKNLSIIILFFAALVLASCEKDGQTKPNRPNPNTRKCATTGTFTRIMCGTGVFGNYWIKLDNGTYMQPCESELITICPIEPQEGQRVKFGYVMASPGNPCEKAFTCLAIIPPSTRIRITCLEFLPMTGCANSGVIVHNPMLTKECNPKAIKLDNGIMLEPTDQGMFRNYKDGDRVSVSYTLVQTFAVTCSGYAAAEITCLNGTQVAPPCRPITIGDDPTPDNSPVQVMGARVEGNCLKIDVGFSGCDDNTDHMQLLWNGNIAESYPAQVSMIVMSNQGATTCGAFFTKTLSFDLSTLKQSPSEKYSIKLTGWDKPLLY